MKKFVTLLIVGFIFIGIGCGLMFYQIANGGLNLRPINEFINGIFSYEISIDRDRIEIHKAR